MTGVGQNELVAGRLPPTPGGFRVVSEAKRAYFWGSHYLTCDCNIPSLAETLSNLERLHGQHLIRAFSAVLFPPLYALQRLDCDLAELDHAGAVLQRERAFGEHAVGQLDGFLQIG